MPKLKQPTKQETKMLLHMQDLAAEQQNFEKAETDKLYENLNKETYKQLVKNIPIQIMEQRVRMLMAQKGKRIVDVVNETGLSRQHIYNLKLRHATLETTRILASYFNVSIDYLIDRDTVQNRVDKPTVQTFILTKDIDKALDKMLAGKTTFEKAFLKNCFKDFYKELEVYGFQKIS